MLLYKIRKIKNASLAFSEKENVVTFRERVSGKVNMFEESELISLLITLGGSFFLWATRRIIINLPFHRLLLVSFGFYLFSKICTVLEGFFWESALNSLEHICSVASCAVFFWWCLRLGARKETGG